MDLGLKGKAAIVTGGTSGIGLSIARRLLEEGTKVFISGRDKDKLKQSIAELSGVGNISGASASVENPADAARLVEEAARWAGRLDIVVSNAGTHLRGTLDELTSEQVDRHFQAKVLGA